MLHLTRTEEVEPYLTDASRLHGRADGVVLPESEKEVSEFLKEANARRFPVTPSGGRTGLAGGAVPFGGWVLSASKLSRILEIHKGRGSDESWARVEPGIYLADLNQALVKDSLFYPPDPTGPFALMGGTLATNASGPKSFKYGPTRRYVRKIRMALATGEVLELVRGKIFAHQEGWLEIPIGKRVLRAALPHYFMPKIKQAAGYFCQSGMDAIDLFIGSEGTLSVITEIEVSLLRKPEKVLAFVVFFPAEEDSWHFADLVRSEKRARSLEYFDSGSLEFLRPRFPSLPKEARACLFIEEEITGEAPVPLVRDEWCRLFEKGKALSPVWEGETPEKEKEFRRFRSELPLEVRDFLSRHGQVKIGTDTCVPHEHFKELMQFHRREVEQAGLKSVTFGHIGDSHVHLNFLPETPEEAEKGRALYPRLVEKAEALGGTFSAEHGVGKLKKPYLLKLYGEKGIEEMRALKRVFDPQGILGPGNLFELQ